MRRCCDAARSLWVLHPDRQVTPWAGRYIVVVDSERKTRPCVRGFRHGRSRGRSPPHDLASNTPASATAKPAICAADSASPNPA
ncbi:hypothetical protein FAZ69_12950 [Trinickia terrae]|uniref:Uncharacterized protein n=1 Tax=Trinickia terrae TaxID=2571161 RepID=A0A4V5PIT9_9BURK|nr:hypothetical protein FAZ69_12950 [Trinickia terrae]